MATPPGWGQAILDRIKTVTDQAAGEYVLPGKYKGYAVSPGPGFDMGKTNLELLYKELGGTTPPR